MSSAPAAPPTMPPPPVWNCGGVVGIDMPTVWWSQEDEGLVITFCINLAVSVSCFFAFVLLSRKPTLAAAIYAPLAVPRSTGRPVPWAPRTWMHVFRLGDHAVQLTNADGGSLDRTMLLRYLRMNLRLFGGFGLVALPVMLPLNAQSWDDGTEPLQPPEPQASQAWSGLESLSITHIPPGSPRFLAPALFMVLFTALFLHELRAEWRAYLTLRHAWLARPRPEALTVRPLPTSCYFLRLLTTDFTS